MGLLNGEKYLFNNLKMLITSADDHAKFNINKFDGIEIL